MSSAGEARFISTVAVCPSVVATGKPIKGYVGFDPTGTSLCFPPGDQCD
jgi:tyrosyl-tRNA synthetase